jgi:hypothetical protein
VGVLEYALSLARDLAYIAGLVAPSILSVCNSSIISPNAYELKLSETYERLHRTFLILLLEPYSRREGEEPPKPVDLDKKDRFQIKSIRKERDSKKNSQFLIK